MPCFCCYVTVPQSVLLVGFWVWRCVGYNRRLQMRITTGWKRALRFVASAVIFESTLSFRQPVFQHQSHHVPRGGGISAPLKSCLGRGWLVPVRQAAGREFRQGRREISPELQPSLVVMLGAAGAGADTTAGAGTAPGSSVDAARATGDTPSPKAEVICCSSDSAVAWTVRSFEAGGAGPAGSRRAK